MYNIAVSWEKQISFFLASSHTVSHWYSRGGKKSLHKIRHFYKTQFRIENYLDEQ